MSPLPLEGIRVTDFGWILAVPHCTAWLGALGAEVIRVESMARPDLGRLYPGSAADGIPGINRSGGFNGLNYSKKSCNLNLSQPKGVELARELIKLSDIVTENFTSGVMGRFGLDYLSLKKINPDIIMLSGTPLGKTGPLKDSVGWGPNTQSYVGMTYMTGYPDGSPGGLGGTWPDYMVGVAMAFAVMSALHYRNRTGEGQHIDLAMGELVMTMLPEGVMDYVMNGRERYRMGNHDEVMAPHNCYRCQGEDKWVAIAVTNEEEWQALCQVIDKPEWRRDERFSDPLSRWKHQDELDRLIEIWTKEHTHYEVMEMLQKAGVPAGPSFDTGELIDDPHFQSRRLCLEMDHPEVGPRMAAGLPPKWSGIEPHYSHAPLFGEHNSYVFHDLLGLSEEEIVQLVEEKVIY